MIKFRKDTQRAVCFKLTSLSELLDINVKSKIPITGKINRIDKMGNSFI
jgi:ATP-dependent helicase/DNAse subunit B